MRQSPRRSGPHAVTAAEDTATAPPPILNPRRTSAPRSIVRGSPIRRAKGARLAAAAAADATVVVIAQAVASVAAAAAAALPRCAAAAPLRGQ